MNKRNSERFGLAYEEGNNAILLGNGINNLNPEFRWYKLLTHLQPDINLADKPFTLAFEEIILTKFKKEYNKEYNQILKETKQKIAEHCSKIEANEYHNKINGLDNIANYITTNYDYMIEKCFDIKFSAKKENKSNNENKYSLERYRSVNGMKVWHIHGEIDNGFRGKDTNKYSSESIMIGQEHYGDYYRRIHQYLKPYATDDKTKAEFIKRDYWVNLFFTHNLHIVGLSLDSSEFHLWWLLAYRASLKKKYGEEIRNKIFYHCASYDTHSRKDKAKIELLKSFDVIIKEIAVKYTDENKYTIYWNDFFKGINEIIEKND
jgi:hypothetical protein